MDVERDLTLEYGGESESGASSAARVATTLPHLSDEELRSGLGAAVSDQIEELFSDVSFLQPAPGVTGASERDRRSGRERRSGNGRLE
jgi:hypothetical protein